MCFLWNSHKKSIQKVHCTGAPYRENLAIGRQHSQPPFSSSFSHRINQNFAIKIAPISLYSQEEKNCKKKPKSLLFFATIYFNFHANSCSGSCNFDRNLRFNFRRFKRFLVILSRPRPPNFHQFVEENFNFPWIKMEDNTSE
jgi:hypothetical protein